MSEIEPNSHLETNRIRHHRRRHYIDASIQGRLFWAMLGMETILFTGSLLWLYQDLSVVIESNLYRIHYVSDNTETSLFSVLWKIIPFVILFNLVAIWLADFVWRSYIKRIIRTLEKFIQQAAKLDLRIMSMDRHVEHEVLKKASLWQQHEQQRYRNLRKAAGALPSELSLETDSQRAQADESLLRLKQLL
ncbi:MAG: hypothetical protein OEY89_18030 [Gammaproteobacteria bacterium]|nr:hypothetical protein [Gammaproteobacteria bacterium]